jgi:hypothetical protein
VLIFWKFSPIYLDNKKENFERKTLIAPLSTQKKILGMFPFFYVIFLFIALSDWTRKEWGPRKWLFGCKLSVASMCVSDMSFAN